MGNKGNKGTLFSQFKVDVANPTRREVKDAISSNTLFSILLQGAGESGKSTVLKQLMLAHGTGFSDEYRLNQGKRILNTTLETAVLILDEMSSDCEDFVELSGVISSIINNDNDVTASVAKDMVKLADNELFQKLYEKDRETLPQLFLESVKNFKNFPTWGGKKWLPNDVEILMNRNRTIGVSKSTFRVKKHLFEVIDVGGQKSQRTKYINLFNDINQILFIAAISDYNLKLWEDPEEDRLQDSLRLFGRVASKKQWEKVSLVLFLNKKDEFIRKYSEERIPLPVLHGGIYPKPPKLEEEEKGDENFSKAIEWFTSLYVHQLAVGRVEKDFVHLTVATDVKLMDVIIKRLITKIANNIIANFYPTSNV